MWNQISLRTRPILTNNLVSLSSKLLHNQSAIKCLPHHRLLITCNPVICQRLITLQVKQFTSSTSSTTLNSTVASTDDQNIHSEKSNIPVKKKVILDEQLLDDLYREMDQHIVEVNQFLQSNSRPRQYKVYLFTLITMVTGVIAGAYTAHLGAWFLDKVGLFIFEEEDDD